MSSIPSLPEVHLDSLAKIVGEFGTGTEISTVLAACGLTDASGESTKWKRLHWVFSKAQRDFRCANRVLDVVASLLAPARFAGRAEEFEKHRSGLNVVLAFSGIEFGKDGQFRSADKAQTLDQAEARVKTIRSKFVGRSIHPEVLKYCRKELMQDNYFHAVFESSKGLLQRVRELSGSGLDGENLLSTVFSVERPMLVFNSLRTESERSEHKGFTALLKGCVGAVRNPLAHDPKILWQVEEDAADFLSLISLLHRRLDSAVRVPQ